MGWKGKDLIEGRKWRGREQKKRWGREEGRNKGSQELDLEKVRQNGSQKKKDRKGKPEVCTASSPVQLKVRYPKVPTQDIKGSPPPAISTITTTFSS